MSTQKLQEKVALITGAGSGMGRASAILFAKEGAKVAVVDIDSKGGNQTVNLIKQDGNEAFFVQADVSKLKDVEGMIKSTIDKYGRLDILYNNAGIPMAGSPVENISEELWDRMMNVNLKSVFLAAKIAIPIMKKQGGGVIINTSSIGGVRFRANSSAYNTSKAAVTALTKGLAIEVVSHNIRVNSISPVATETPMQIGFMTEEMKKDLEGTKKRMLSSIPIGRFAKPEDIAKAALYLASDDSSMVTGIDLYVDGGRSI
jgi:3-oxoacyl-[acyl-carrier protein] reductase